jgi:hypothetical protein
MFWQSRKMSAKESEEVRVIVAEKCSLGENARNGGGDP